MTKIFLPILLLLSINLTAQTNIFQLNGNVGIGTASPVGPLQIKGSSNNMSGLRNALILDNSTISGNRSSDIIWAANGVAKWEMGNDVGANGGQSFYLFDLENTVNPRFFINSDGNVGIGTANPKSKFDVSGQISSYLVSVGQSDISTSPKNFVNLGTNNHGSVLLSSNLYISGNDNLKIANVHSTMAGAAILIPGNSM